MKTIPSLWKCYRAYLARISILLVTAAFIAGIVGCGQYTAPVIRTLTIVSTTGGSVVTPGHGNFTYTNGTTVNLVAVPNNGYLFTAWTGDVRTIANVNVATTTITMNNSYSIEANFVRRYGLTAGGWHTLGLKTDGTVVAVGDNTSGQCDVGHWTGISQIAAGGLHTLGRKANGTVVAVGSDASGQRDVGAWTGIIQVAAGGQHTVGLKANGTAVAVGDDSYWQCNVGSWDLD